MTEQPRHTAGPRGPAVSSPWSPGSPAGPKRWPRRTIASFAGYEEAEEAVDRLSDLDFPVERVAIIGPDLQTVEQVTGKMDYPRAAWHGAVSGYVNDAQRTATRDARGQPQIEVIFEIDANGILNVTARDKDTGAQQGITISESTNLDASDVERMVTEAERNRSPDQQLRQEVDARNELDTVAYHVQRRLDELGDAAPTHERARAEMLVADARQAVADQAPMDRVRELTGELQQVLAGLSAVSVGSGGAGGGGGAADATSETDDDVIDAEFDRNWGGR